MKRLISITMIALVITLAGGLAGASDDREHRRYGDNSYPGKFYGTVETMPAEGWQGTWVINGREVMVTERTKIEEEYGRAVPGAYVEVEGNYAGTVFTAYEIEIKGQKKYRDQSASRDRSNSRQATGAMSRHERAFNSKFKGTIESMPEGGYEGQWIINGRAVMVTGKTFVDESEGRATVGARAKVKGVRTEKGISAYEIEIDRK